MQITKLMAAHLRVLKAARDGVHGYEAHRLLDKEERRLLARYRDPGKGAGWNFTKVSRIAQVFRELERLGLVKHTMVWTVGKLYRWDDDAPEVEAGSDWIALYQLA